MNSGMPSDEIDQSFIMTGGNKLNTAIKQSCDMRDKQCQITILATTKIHSHCLLFTKFVLPMHYVKQNISEKSNYQYFHFG